jgi:hypothetical protein
MERGLANGAGDQGYIVKLMKSFCLSVFSIPSFPLPLISKGRWVPRGARCFLPPALNKSNPPTNKKRWDGILHILGKDYDAPLGDLYFIYP